VNRIILRKRIRSRYQPKVPRRFSKRLVLLTFAVLAGLLLISSSVVFFAFYQFYTRGYIPIEELIEIRSAELTRVYDRSGENELGVLANPNALLSNPIPLSRVSNYMIAATISTEDNTFWDNQGVSYLGILRAGFRNYVLREEAPGGSTITQQLVKNVYICKPLAPDDPCTAARTLDRKLREIFYAIELEGDYEKEQIITWYLNQISYASRYIGVESASTGYFAKPAKDLTLAESAILASIPSSPTLYHPRSNCVTDENMHCSYDLLGRTIVDKSSVLKRIQELNLDLMVEHGWINSREADIAKREVIYVYRESRSKNQQLVSFVDNLIEPRLVRMCQRDELPLIEGFKDCVTSVHSAGWRVETTLDYKATQMGFDLVNEMVTQGLRENCECYNAALITINPVTGQVLVYIPNREPSNNVDPRVSGDIDQLIEINQPGSSFKPVVYLAWFLNENKVPMSALWDTSPLEIKGYIGPDGEPVAIVNPRRAVSSSLGEKIKSEGLITARAGMGGSQNVPAFRAANEAGLEAIIEMAKRLGITTLEQGFDPTFRSHSDAVYGASIATGGANIRALDMAYMNATIANMGVMVGVPHYADTLSFDEIKETAFDIGADYELALEQKLDFQRGHLRLPGTRSLDPVVILRVFDSNGKKIFEHDDPYRLQVVEPAAVWLLHSIMSDCTARFVIWGCGSSNEDFSLDAVLDGEKIPIGLKTGTQQGLGSIDDTLETWMNGYSRHAAVAVWVGNANNQLVNDGAAAGYASAHTTLYIFKNWMSQYHKYLLDTGLIKEIKNFDELQPRNVKFVNDFLTPATDRILTGGGCEQLVEAWIRTDVEYEDPCEEQVIDTRNGLLASAKTPNRFREIRRYPRLPSYNPESVLDLVSDPPASIKLSVAPRDQSDGSTALMILSPISYETIHTDITILGSVQIKDVTQWTLEYGRGTFPEDDEWFEITTRTGNVSLSALGRFIVRDRPSGVYTIRLRGMGRSAQDLELRIYVNLDKKNIPDQPIVNIEQPIRSIFTIVPSSSEVINDVYVPLIPRIVSPNSSLPTPESDMPGQ
jgi:membrane peptidoglycan carboxypeptidase